MSMQLQNGEKKVRTFFHHPIPLLITDIKIAIVSLPYFFVVWIFRGSFSTQELLQLYWTIIVGFSIIILYEGVIYFFDRLVITDQRVLYINWRSIFQIVESAAQFSEIQNILTTEIGILSFIPLFNYGTIQLETAATDASIQFEDAIHPDGIKEYIYQLQK